MLIKAMLMSLLFINSSIAPLLGLTLGSVWVYFFILSQIILVALYFGIRTPRSDEAIVRNGYSPQKVSLSKPILVIPLLQTHTRVRLRTEFITFKYEPKTFEGKGSVQGVVYLKVGTEEEQILRAAKTFGSKTLKKQALEKFSKGKLSRALSEVFKKTTLEQAAESPLKYRDSAKREIGKTLLINGIEVEDIHILIGHKKDQKTAKAVS